MLFQQSVEHYQAGRYAVAAALLEEAYALFPDGKLLYNLARARDADNDLKGALEAYEAFLRTGPLGKRKENVEQRVAQLRAQLAPPPPVEPTEPPPVVTPPSSEPPVVAEPDKPAEPDDSGDATEVPKRRKRRVGPWVVMGIGAVLLGTSLAVGPSARADNKRAMDLKDQMMYDQAEAAQNTAEKKQAVATVLLSVGGAAAIAGGVWLYFDRRTPGRSKKTSRSHSLQLGLSRVDWSLTF